MGYGLGLALVELLIMTGVILFVLLMLGYIIFVHLSRKRDVNRKKKRYLSCAQYRGLLW